MNEQIKNIIAEFRIASAKAREALRIEKVSEDNVQLYTTILPDFQKLITEDIVSFFLAFRKKVIMHLWERGFPERKIKKDLKEEYKIIKPFVIEYETDKKIVKLKEKEDSQFQAKMEEVINE